SLVTEVAGMKMEHSGQLRIGSVGKDKHGAEPCRWIELAVTRTKPALPDEVIKLLIPEKHLKAGADPTANVVKAWHKRGDAPPVEGDRERPEFRIGPVNMFLSGPLKDLKKLDAQDVTVEGLGKLPCNREAGKAALRF